MTVEREIGTILIVDDNSTNLGLLFDFLTEAGFKVLVARNGKSALKKVEYSAPDLILLDVLMPEMDGFETCQHLKASATGKEIPVIFMTALTETEDKVKGFNLGAVDYITKPIQHEEVLARVRTHLSIRNLTKELQEQNSLLEREIGDRIFAQTELEKLTQELERRVRERTEELSRTNERLEREIKERRSAESALQKSLQELQLAQSQLVQSEKMSALGQLVAGVAHEINNPVNFIYGNLQPVRDYIGDLLGFIHLYQQHCPNPIPEMEEAAEAIELDFLVEDLPKMLDSMQVGADRIREIVLSLRHFSRHEGPEMRPTNLHDGIDSTLMILQNRLKSKPNRPGIEVIKNYCPDLPKVECYGGELNQVFMNILANAIDAIEEYNQQRTLAEIEANPSQITIRTGIGNREWGMGNGEWGIDAEEVAIVISDNGPGMSEETCSNIFNPFFTTKPPGKGTGIGLSISWQIVVEKHHGSIQCISKPGVGTEFVIKIPIRQQAPALAASA